MGLINKLKDHFNKAEFSVAPNKKIKTISKQFFETFNLSLVFYVGKKIADPDLTIAALDSRTSKKVVKQSEEELKIKGSMKVGDAETLFDKHFGVTVQIKDATGKKLVPNEITIGEASRGEY